MANEVKLPVLGENIASGQVVDVKVAVGDMVKEGQALVEVEAEKSTVEVPSPMAGRVTKILVQKGTEVKTGATLVMLEAGDGQTAVPAAKAAESKPAPAPEAKTPVAESKPTTTPAPAPKEQPRPAAKEAAVAVAQPAEHASNGEDSSIHAGPATRKMAREWGIDLHQVPGSGEKGRVSQEDIKSHIRTLASGGGGGGSAPVAAKLPDFSQWGAVEDKPLETIRKRTAEQMTRSWTTIPHVTHHDLADVTDIEAFRKQQAEKGEKLTVTSFLLKACSIVLKEMPQFNSSLDLAGGKLILKKYIHLGVAVDTDRGLLVPVLRDVDKKSVHEIGREMTELAEKGRQKKLSADDMRGGTFTISNLGGIGGIGFSPIINWPEVAILGVSRARMQPVYRDGGFVPRLLLPLSLSYDHRVIDGADGARFTRRVADLLEKPLMMLMHA